MDSMLMATIALALVLGLVLAFVFLMRRRELSPWGQFDKKKKA